MKEFVTYSNWSTVSRWFKVTFRFSSWRSLSPSKGHLTIPKRPRRIARLVFCFWLVWGWGIPHMDRAQHIFFIADFLRFQIFGRVSFAKKTYLGRMYMLFCGCRPQLVITADCYPTWNQSSRFWTQLPWRCILIWKKRVQPQPDQTQIHPHRYKYRIVPIWSEEMQEFELGRHKLLQVWGLSLKSILRFKVLTGWLVPCFWLFILLQLAAVVFWGGPRLSTGSGFTSFCLETNMFGWVDTAGGTGLFLGLAATAQRQRSKPSQSHWSRTSAWGLWGVVTSRSGNTPWKFNSSPLKYDGWKTILSYWGPGLC